MMRRLAALAVGLAMASAAWSLEPAADFKQNCATCHTIGGGNLTGPDLKDVSKRRDREWLLRYVTDPKTMLASDPVAMELLKEFRGTVMPNVAGMTRERAEAFVKLIEAESALEKSQFIGLQISDRPLTESDVAQGAAFFTGAARLKGGGPPCMSCHRVAGMTGLGGGALGPDLTPAYGKLGGRKGLGAWLAAPPTPTMQPIFTKHPIDSEEILPMVAFLKSKAEGPRGAPPDRLSFVTAGLGGAVFLFLAFDMTWKRRFRGVRRTMVMKQKSDGGKS
jgi:mono/diheme cytochrome c family protein